MAAIRTDCRDNEICFADDGDGSACKSVLDSRLEFTNHLNHLHRHHFATLSLTKATVRLQIQRQHNLRSLATTYRF
jgi:hypothetical protein